MRRGFLYLVAVMDWASRRVLSWRLSNTLEADFCVAALEEALARYGRPGIFNTDQGSQFTGFEFTDVLKKADVKISMDGKGRWIDNVMVERLWRTLKYGCVYLNAFETGSEARDGIGKWFERYNGRRPHSSLASSCVRRPLLQPPYASSNLIIRISCISSVRLMGAHLRLTHSDRTVHVLTTGQFICSLQAPSQSIDYSGPPCYHVHQRREAMKEVMARGTNFVYARDFIQSTYGHAVWEKALAALPPEDASLWKGAALVSGLYPFRAFKAMVAALSKALGKVEDTETARLYEYIAGRSLSTIYKLFFRLAEPSFVIKNYPKLWERFFDSGKVEVPLAEKGHALLKFTLPEIFMSWIAPACLGYSRKAVALSGGRNLALAEKSRTLLPDGQWEITYELHWQQ
jgi:hypothetical protein